MRESGQVSVAHKKDGSEVVEREREEKHGKRTVYCTR